MACGQIENRQGTALGSLITAVPGVVAGILLCVSSVAHLYATFALNSPPDLPGGRAGVLTLAALQTGIGTLLLSNPRGRWPVGLGSMLFTAFAAYTGVLVYREGDADCGCFALWSPPSTVMFLVDCGIAAGLLALLRARMVAPTGRWQTGLALLTAAAVPPLLAAALSLPQTGITKLPTGELYLDPTRWVGQKLPLAGVVDGVTELSHRPRCLLLFVSHDCPHCRRLLASLSPDWMAEAGIRPGELTLLWIRGPGPKGLAPPGAVSLRATEGTRLVVHLPTAVALRRGVVTAAVSGVDDRSELEWLIRSLDTSREADR